MHKGYITVLFFVYTIGDDEGCSGWWLFNHYSQQKKKNRKKKIKCCCNITQQYHQYGLKNAEQKTILCIPPEINPDFGYKL
jgi:hypothetical protein